MTLPQEIAKHIEQQAKEYAQMRCNDFEGKKNLHRKTLLMYAHMAGATEWASGVKELYDLLDEAYLKIKYLHEKFDETGSGNNVLSRIETALAKYKEVSK